MQILRWLILRYSKNKQFKNAIIQKFAVERAKDKRNTHR